MPTTTLHATDETQNLEVDLTAGFHSNLSAVYTFTFVLPAGCWTNYFFDLDCLQTNYGEPGSYSGPSDLGSASFGSTDGAGISAPFFFNISDDHWAGNSGVSHLYVDPHIGGILTLSIQFDLDDDLPRDEVWKATTTSVTLTLSGSSGSFAITPTSAHYGVAGGTGTIAVTTSSACPWTAVSNAPWIHVTSGASGSGSGTVAYSVDTNYSGSSRTGTITVAGQTFTVTQDCCTFSVSPPSFAASATGEKDFVAVTPVDTHCTWTATTDLPFHEPPDDASWIRVLPGSDYVQCDDGTDNAVAIFNGTGTNRVYVQILPNGSDGAVARSANILVQSGCQLIRIPVMQGVQSGGGSGPGTKTPGTNPWCLHDRYGRFHVVTCGDGGILYFRSDFASPLANAMDATLTDGWNLASALVAASGANARMVIDFRDRLHLISEGSGGGLAYFASDDDGKTWSSDTVPIPNALKPTIATGHDRTIIVAAYVPDDPDHADDGGTLQGVLQGPGDPSFSPVFTFQDQDGAAIPAANDTFHLSNALEGPNRWLLVLHKDGDT